MRRVFWVGILATTALGASRARSGSLSFGCTDPPLDVSYDIKYYSGVVNCGNLLLESDIGGTHAWIPPTVSFASAEQGKYYLLAYIDPDVDLPNNGSWPDVQTPGSKAPARHWVVGNIPGEDLRSGDLSKATTVSAYKGPSPPWGSHRYGQFLFEQPGLIEYETLPSPKGIYNWGYDQFIANYSLGKPVATNYHMTQHMDPRE